MEIILTFLCDQKEKPTSIGYNFRKMKKFLSLIMALFIALGVVMASSTDFEKKKKTKKKKGKKEQVDKKKEKKSKSSTSDDSEEVE